MTFLRRASRPECLPAQARADGRGLVVMFVTDKSLENLVGCFHGHTAKVRYKVRTVRMASKTAFCAEKEVSAISNDL